MRHTLVLALRKSIASAFEGHTLSTLTSPLTMPTTNRPSWKERCLN